MNPKSTLFSHQFRLICALSEHFEVIEVFSLQSLTVGLSVPGNVKVSTLNWYDGHARIFKLIKFAVLFIKSILRGNRSETLVLAHMVDILAAYVGPICKLCKVPIIIWYAHKKNSVYFQFATYFADSIITSTRGSCPYGGRKLVVLGQMIDEKLFTATAQNRATNDFKKFIHVGRLDPSKRIEEIIESYLAIFGLEPGTNLVFIGKSSPEHASYFSHIHSRYRVFIDEGKISFLGERDYAEVIEILRHSDLFLHAFNGSLDKSVLEATLLKVPVATTNLEYHRALKEEYQESLGIEMSLKEEIIALMNLSEVELERLVNERSLLVHKHHSLTSWVDGFMKLVSRK